MKELAYFTLVRPQVEYAASTWEPWLHEDINSLEKLQCRGARFVTGNYHWTESVTGMAKH